jgi:hypothetical protein
MFLCNTCFVDQSPVV